MRTWNPLQRRGFTAIEVSAAMGALAVLFTLGASVYKGARLSARVATAQSNLRQVGTYLELYFRKFGQYPPQGSDLLAALGAVGADSRVVANPLVDEQRPGDTVNALYRAPSLEELDSPNTYLTAMVSDNGHTAVILYTGSRIDRCDDLAFDPSNLPAVLAMLTDAPPPSGQAPEPEPEPDPEPPPGNRVSGEVNINPSNNSDYEFELRKPDGSTITRDDLHASGGDLEYIGPATWVRFRPKGNGNQNSLTLDDQPYPVQNGTCYTIEVLQGGAMSVHLYNDHPNGNGKSMGKWWISITATGATITPG
ncbi:MAG TPA: type II secretion system protein [Planctomycetota bacterium]|nr:type II secretion system protein [Planctomycetota bacterium]